MYGCVPTHRIITVPSHPHRLTIRHRKFLLPRHLTQRGPPEFSAFCSYRTSWSKWVRGGGTFVVACGMNHEKGRAPQLKHGSITANKTWAPLNLPLRSNTPSLRKTLSPPLLVALHIAIQRRSMASLIPSLQALQLCITISSTAPTSTVVLAGAWARATLLPKAGLATEALTSG